MALPHLTPEQRAEALQKATVARRRRAEIKGKLKNRELSLSQVLALAENDEAVAKMRVLALLESLPRVGVTTADHLMDEYGNARTRRVRGLGHVQAQALIDRFG